MPKSIKIILAAVVSLGLLFYLLSFGNPQWGKWIYMWQGFVWPAKKFEYKNPGYISGMDTKSVLVGNPQVSIVPDNYTGRWRIWNKSGILLSDMHFKNGSNVGVVRSWDESGKLNHLSYFSQDPPQFIRIYDVNRLDERKKYKHLLGPADFK